MKPINIYQMTRMNTTKALQFAERRMSNRGKFLQIKNWEVEGLKCLADSLFLEDAETADYDFFYSFQIPKLGKEFDLLRISSETVINIELKCGNVSDDTIRKQLLLNRDYLMPLGKVVRLYTYISNDKRLVRLSNSGNVIDTYMGQLVEDLRTMDDVYDSDIEELFKEEKYLLSPITAPDRFLRGEYFLTSQQKDIKRQILKKIKSGKTAIMGFTGLPGTGKTLLLYDLAMALSLRDEICVLHYGSYRKELLQLDERLHRISFSMQSEKDSKEAVKVIGEKKYSAVLIDEGHRISKEEFYSICECTKEKGIPLIVSFDSEESVCPFERGEQISGIFLSRDELVLYRLTNRIRLNSELSSFIQGLMLYRPFAHRKDYPNISILSSNDSKEEKIILKHFIKEGYVYIRDDSREEELPDIDSTRSELATCREFDNVIMTLNHSFVYDENGYLRSSNPGSVRKLFHGLSRAKKRIALIVVSNDKLLENILVL